MGSVVGYMKCPQCGGLMAYDFDYRTEEEYRFCKRCGKRQEWYYERDKETSKVIFNDNGSPIWKEEETFGYGCLCFETKDGIGKLIGLEEPAKQEDVDNFLKDLEDNAEVIDKDSCYFTYWDAESGTIKSYYGKIPDDYDDECGE